MSLENVGHLEVRRGQGGVYLWLGGDSRAYWGDEVAHQGGRGGRRGDAVYHLKILSQKVMYLSFGTIS